MVMPKRRHLLNTAGSLALFGFAGEAMADSEESGTEEAGITEDVRSLIASGRSAQAQNLLERHNIQYNRSVSTTETGSGSNGDVSGSASNTDGTDGNSSVGTITPDWHYNNPDRNSDGVTISTWLYNVRGDEWTVFGEAQFPAGYEHRVNESGPVPQTIPDACGIVFDHAEWSAPTPSEEGVTYFQDEECQMYHDEYNPNYGVTAKPNWQGGVPDSIGVFVGMSTTLEKDTAESASVQFVYEHTLRWTDLLPGEISVSVGVGGVSVTLPSGSQTAWREEVVARK